MDTNAPPLDDEVLPGVVQLLVDRAQSRNAVDRHAAVEELYELAYKVGPKIAAAIPVLIHAIAEPDEKLGSSAQWALSYCVPDSVEPLIECLKHPHAYVRERAAHSLGNIGDSAQPAAPALRPLLVDADQAVRKRAAWTLGLIHDTDQETILALVKLAVQGSSIDKSAALHGLGNIGKALDDSRELQFHQSLILGALEDASSDVRHSGLYAMESLGLAPQAAADLILALLDREESSPVLRSALERLEALAPTADLRAGVPRIIACLPNRSDEASQACRVLGAMRPAPKEAIGALRDALHIDELVVPAATALWKIDKSFEYSVVHLQRVFDGNGESICDLICEVGPAAAALLPEVVAALCADDWDLQWAAADALGAVASSDPIVVAALMHALSHPSPIVRPAAARSIARVGKTMVPGLQLLVATPEDPRCAWAAFALGEMGPTAVDALPELRVGMQLRREPLSSCCAIAVALIGGEMDCIPFLIEVLFRDDSQAPRRAAAAALGQMGPAARSATRALEGLLDDEDYEVAQAAGNALASDRTGPQ
jgi:HEAT repeat protein